MSLHHSSPSNPPSPMLELVLLFTFHGPCWILNYWCVSCVEKINIFTTNGIALIIFNGYLAIKYSLLCPLQFCKRRRQVTCYQTKVIAFAFFSTCIINICVTTYLPIDASNNYRVKTEKLIMEEMYNTTEEKER